MDRPSPASERADSGYFTTEQCDISEFAALVEQPTDLADTPHASAIDHRVPIYHAPELRAALAGRPSTRRVVQAELARVFLDGPGIAVFTHALDANVVDRATEAFRAMIDDQHARGARSGDHYAKPGANDRVWNALEKLALAAPETFVDYYASDIIALVSESWLGRWYQVTSQINVVNPGGEAQSPHRDYHLGFLSDADAEQFPAHVHALSPVLTLQGAIAHCDMPVETGPTMYLPYAQKYAPGYLAWRRPEFKEYFQRHHVQLPLARGDAVFFNPAMFHAAGENRTTDVKRMGNLLQVSSAFGRALESVDRQKMANAIFPALLDRRAGGLDEQSLRNAVTACVDGYPFPTNLDHDQPIDGLMPESQAELLGRAVVEHWSPDRLRTELSDHAGRRRTTVTQRDTLDAWR